MNSPKWVHEMKLEYECLAQARAFSPATDAMTNFRLQFFFKVR